MAAPFLDLRPGLLTVATGATLLGATATVALVAVSMPAMSGDKYEVCHLPEAEGSWHTITVAGPAVDAHLRHDDLEGACDAHCESLCDDGDLCTVSDVGACEDGCPTPEPVDCDDGDACTIDSCDSAQGCEYTAVECGAGEACNSSTGACEASGPAGTCGDPLVMEGMDEHASDNRWTVEVEDGKGSDVHASTSVGTSGETCGGDDTAEVVVEFPDLGIYADSAFYVQIYSPDMRESAVPTYYVLEGGCDGAELPNYYDVGDGSPSVMCNGPHPAQAVFGLYDCRQRLPSPGDLLVVEDVPVGWSVRLTAGFYASPCL